MMLQKPRDINNAVSYFSYLSIVFLSYLSASGKLTLN
jgi:hypothetical protein